VRQVGGGSWGEVGGVRQVEGMQVDGAGSVSYPEYFHEFVHLLHDPHQVHLHRTVLAPPGEPVVCVPLDDSRARGGVKLLHTVHLLIIRTCLTCMTSPPNS
jgi:hypothetical protein